MAVTLHELLHQLAHFVSKLVAEELGAPPRNLLLLELVEILQVINLAILQENQRFLGNLVLIFFDESCRCILHVLRGVHNNKCRVSGNLRRLEMRVLLEAIPDFIEELDVDVVFLRFLVELSLVVQLVKNAVVGLIQ